MKTVTSAWKIFLITALFSLKSVISSGQPTPEYTFTSPVLLSGTLNAVGSVYRFSTVKSGLDAIVTITGAVNASVAILDQTGSGGYDAAFQPNITVTKLTTGYVDFNIDFVQAGTFILANQSGVNITALDIDGYNYAANQQLYEFEQFDMGAGSSVYYYFDGTDLSFTYVGSTAIRADNVGGVEYGSINTSQNVRFTMYTHNITNVKVRSGAINNDQFNNVTRQRSFYFARFNYSNIGVLDGPDLENFSGNAKGSVVELNWKLVQNHKVSQVELERSVNNQVYEKVADINSFAANEFSFTDKTAAKGNNYYRLKLYESNGNYTYSNILKIATENKNSASFTIYPTIVTKGASMMVSSDRASKELLMVVDASGRLRLQKYIDIPEGTSVKSLQELAGLEPGNYIVILNIDKQKLVQRIIVPCN